RAFRRRVRAAAEALSGNSRIAVVKYRRFTGARLPDAGLVAVGFGIDAPVNSSTARDLEPPPVVSIRTPVPGGLGFFVLWEQLSEWRRGARGTLSADMRTLLVNATAIRVGPPAAGRPFGAPSRTRTDTVQILSLLPLPIGL